MPLPIRLAKALENARAITNIEIQFDDLLWVKGMPDAHPPFNVDYSRTMHVKYMAAGQKYRYECRCESAQTTNVIKLTETAFDGKLWSSYDGGIWMVQQNGDRVNDLENPYNPLIQPFLFLSSSSDDCDPGGLRFVDLRSPDILNGISYREAEGTNGRLRLLVTGLPLNGVDQLWSIVINDADPDFKPVSISRIVYAGSSQLPFDSETTCIFLDYTNLGEYPFPTKMAYQVFNLSTNRLTAPSLVLTGLVTMVSVQIPQQIPDATFRLDEAKAPKIWNADAEKGYGVGLMLGEKGTNIVIRRVIAGSPAEAENELRVGDRILSIAQSNAPPILVHAGKTDLPRAAALLQGSKGTPVQITFVPGGKEDSPARTVTLIRTEVRGRSGAAAFLAPGTKAPDLEMVTLTNRTIEHLSDYTGKIVVLEFWASWCSPCQSSMADLQLDFARHPDWKNKVVLLAASVDDTADIAAKHVQNKGWSQTHNVWPRTKGLQSYHIAGIPFAYVIDAKENIVASGVVAEGRLDIAKTVNQQLDGGH